MNADFSRERLGEHPRGRKSPGQALAAPALDTPSPGRVVSERTPPALTAAAHEQRYGQRWQYIISVRRRA